MGIVTHGEAHTKRASPEYRAWCAMKNRCNNPKQANYPYYGGRGIKICAAWSRYEAFLSDMGRKPSPKHSLDRINVNGDYEPSNCRWADRYTQKTNRNVRRIEQFTTPELVKELEARFARGGIWWI